MEKNFIFKHFEDFTQAQFEPIKSFRLQDELNDEETNVSDDELIDDIDNIEAPEEPKRKLKEDDDLDLDELIEEYNKLSEKYKNLRNDYSLYNRR